MTERESFIASIREQPDADAPRLAFADYIEERGEHDHAELIRAQVNLARLKPRPVLHISGNFRQRLRSDGKNGVVSEFKGEFAPPVGIMLRPGACFDAAEPVQWGPGEPAQICAVGCVVERLNPPLRDNSVSLAGTIHSSPCPLRHEVRALDGVANLLIAKLDANFAPPRSGFLRFGTAEGFSRPLFSQVNPPAELPQLAVLVRRGFVEHIRCSWEAWLRWADWFRANHPCERVTLTTMPDAGMRHDSWNRNFEVSLPGVARASWRFTEEELNFARGGGSALVRGAVGKMIRDQWPGTSFALPGEVHDWPNMRNFAAVPPATTS